MKLKKTLIKSNNIVLVRKVNWNKTTGQPSVTLPKKILKKYSKVKLKEVKITW